MTFLRTRNNAARTPTLALLPTRRATLNPNLALRGRGRNGGPLAPAGETGQVRPRKGLNRCLGGITLIDNGKNYEANTTGKRVMNTRTITDTYSSEKI